MRTPLVLVTATLMIAILLAASLLIVIEIRGHNRMGGNAEPAMARRADRPGVRPVSFESITRQSAPIRSIAP
jgi:hypothetical protein